MLSPCSIGQISWSVIHSIQVVEATWTSCSNAANCNTIPKLLLGPLAKLRKETVCFVSVCLSVSVSALNKFAFTGRIFLKFDISIFWKIYQENWSVFQNWKKITGTLHEDLREFMITYRRILSRMTNVSDKSCRENRNTHFVFNKVFPKIVSFMR